MNQSSNEPKTSNSNLFYSLNKENNNRQKNNIYFYKDSFFNSINELMYNKYDEGLIYEEHEQNKNNSNPYIFQSYESEKVESEVVFNVGLPYDSKKRQNDNISDEDLYNTKYTTKTKIQTNNLFVTKKKRYIDQEKTGKNRRKFDDDNIKKKIKTDYFTFIIIKEFTKKNNITFDSVFYDLASKYKSNVTKEYIKLLQTQTIKDVIKTDISPHYTIKNKNSNLITCNKIEEEIKLKEIDNILNKKILYFFETIYFQKRKEKYNLKELNLIDLEIVLDKEEIGLFEDLLDKNKKNEDNFNFDEYKTNMIKCCENYFFQKKIFKTRQTQIEIKNDKSKLKKEF